MRWPLCVMPSVRNLLRLEAHNVEMETSCFDIAALQEFYGRLSSEGGMAIADFQADLAELFRRTRPTDELNDYRLGRADWKKLRDEVSPVSHFLRFRGVATGRIRFPLNSEAPDCWFWQDGDPDRRGIEVTVALGRAGHHLGLELIEKGIGRGFLGLQDDAPKEAFTTAMARERIMHSSEGLLSTTRDGILRCLTRKNRPKFAGFTLLIQAQLPLPPERWNAAIVDLRSAAAPLPFDEIHVISARDSEPWGFQIK